MSSFDDNSAAAAAVAPAPASSGGTKVQRHLKTRHLSMIAIGGSIGTGHMDGAAAGHKQAGADAAADGDHGKMARL